MNNANRVVDYILSNAGKLTPDKIKALAGVVGALGDEKEKVIKEPNKLPEEKNYVDLSGGNPISLKDVDGFQIEGDENIYPIRSEKD